MATPRPKHSAAAWSMDLLGVCEACRAWEGRHGAHAAHVSRGTPVLLSQTKNHLSSVAWDKQCRPFPDQNPNGGVHRGVPIGAFTEPLWHPLPSIRQRFRRYFCLAQLQYVAPVHLPKGKGLQPRLQLETRAQRKQAAVVSSETDIRFAPTNLCHKISLQCPFRLSPPTPPNLPPLREFFITRNMF